ncbi:MAG: dTDP-4-dehydrorhamnose reductase [Nitrosomonas sp. PRO4]|nr:dTDP-4-dehydrorhamnose reductase [Nitrosomonas sp. PRO4]
MKILLFGKNGQVGWELQRSLAPLGELIALSSGSSDFCGDLANPSRVKQTIRKIKPDIIVNAAAYTSVDKAESESKQAHALNAQAPSMLAQEALELNACLVHYSTDYVFSGNGNLPYVETDATDPINIYGETKLEGENNIIASGCSYLIFRTSWVFSTHGNNFIKSILRLAQQRDKLTVVDDQIGSPTGAELIADVTANILHSLRYQHKVNGIYHLVAKGYISWYQFAEFILEHARHAEFTSKIQPDTLLPIASADFPLPAKRPLNSRLNTCKLENQFGLHLPDWQAGVSRTIEEILSKGL